MLEKINLDKKMKAKEYDEIMAHLEIRLGVLQRACKEKGIPVMILMEGLEASGKGTMINRMIRALDPRGFCVFTMEKESEEEKMRAYMWRFMTKMPEKGRI
ncbi:MAG: phosphate--AMP phosphotransferase, partial [Eubacterium sp.]|nr:phosphate--AMP phosphotransferase [Eubacterium sp.]